MVELDASWSKQLGLSASCTCRPGEAAEGSGRTEACAGDRMESANEALRTLPVTCPQRQAANDRRRGGCPRARGLRDQSRGHGISKGVTQPGLWTARVVVRSTGSTGPPLQSRGMSRRHQSCRGEDGTTAGELPTESMWPIIDRRRPQTGTSPDGKSGNAVANPRIRACSPTSSGPVLSSTRSTA